MFDAIYKDFGSTDVLADHFTMCLTKYGQANVAYKFIQALMRDQEMVCRTHTRYFFSASCKSSQRGEGTNSRIKGGGSKKQELREFNLLQFLQWHLNQVELQEEKSLIIITSLIEGNHKWSAYVQNAWQNS